MASNYGSDQEMERALREHFEAEAQDLRAPENLWARLEDRMDLPPTRHPVTQVRRKILGALKQNWFPVMATGGAVAVAASAVFLASRATQDEFGASESYAAAAPAPAIAAPVERTAAPAAAAPAAAAPAATAAPAMTPAPAAPGRSAEAAPAARVVIKELPALSGLWSRPLSRRCRSRRSSRGGRRREGPSRSKRMRNEASAAARPPRLLPQAAAVATRPRRLRRRDPRPRPSRTTDGSHSWRRL